MCLITRVVAYLFVGCARDKVEHHSQPHQSFVECRALLRVVCGVSNLIAKYPRISHTHAHTCQTAPQRRKGFDQLHSECTNTHQCALCLRAPNPTEYAAVYRLTARGHVHINIVAFACAERAGDFTIPANRMSDRHGGTHA